MRSAISDKLCGSDQIKKFAQKGARQYYRCLKCGTIFLYPEPSSQELKDYYCAMPENYLMAMTQSKSNAIKFNYLFDHFLRKYISKPKATLVDVGCFTGDFLEVCRTRGIKKAYGFEVNEQAINVMKEKRLKVIKQPFEESTFFQKEAADVICMLDLIEHVKEPIAYLKKAFSILRKSGFLIITTPNTDSVFSKLLGGLWPVFDGNEHLRLYNPENLSALLTSLGFTIYEKKRLKKKTTVSYFLQIISAWMNKSERKDKKRKRNSSWMGEIPIVFYGGEFIIIAKK